MECSYISCRSVRPLVYYSEKTEKRERFLKIKFWRPRKGGLAGYMVQAFGEPMTNAAALRCRMLHLDKGLFLNYNEHCSVWGDSMNKAVTTKEEILKIGRELIRQQGWAAINIRAVAAACSVSVGSIYNYFTSKADLVGAIVESVWHEIFHRSEDETVFRDIQACIAWLYQQMEYGHKQYPGFFALHSLSFIHEEKADGKNACNKPGNTC